MPEFALFNKMYYLCVRYVNLEVVSIQISSYFRMDYPSCKFFPKETGITTDNGYYSVFFGFI